MFGDLTIEICQSGWHLRHSFSEAQLTQPWGHGEHSLVAGGINQTNIFTLVIFLFFLILVEVPWKQSLFKNT